MTGTWIVLGLISLLYFVAGAAIPKLFGKKLTGVMGRIVIVELMFVLWIIPALYVMAAIRHW